MDDQMPFNCTVEELKLEYSRNTHKLTVAFNCTVEELKHNCISNVEFNMPPFNCTVEELKPNYAGLQPCPYAHF